MSIGIGIDVSKDKVDVASSDGRWSEVFPQTDAGRHQLSQKIAAMVPHRVVLEASGGYEHAMLIALVTENVPVVLVQPGRARHFAKAIGQLAKTDAIDAQVLAQMALVGVEATPLWQPLDENVSSLRGLVGRRQQLVLQRDNEKKRRRGATNAVLESIERLLCFLKTELQAIEKQIMVLLGDVPSLKVAVDTLESVQGVGCVTATTLLVSMPELGRVDRGEIAALAGVAPMNSESGKWKGQRFIQGGRPAARKALYMAALAAIVHNETIKTYYAGLRARGKPGKLALVACMRKLLVHLNAKMRMLLIGGYEVKVAREEG